MTDQSEERKVKLILYLIDTEVREIYSTMPFDTAEGERTVVELLQALDSHCHPCTNETVELSSFLHQTRREW